MENRDKPCLVKRLMQEPGAFDPITAFRIAEKSAPVLHIASHLGVSLVVHPVSGVQQDADGALSIKTSLASLSGPLGSLPPVYNEIAMREARNHAHAFSAFLNIFNTRLAELFVDSCEKYRLTRLLRWQSRTAGTFLKSLLSLAGFGTANLVEHANVSRNILLYYSGFWAAKTRNAANLAAILSDFSGLPVAIAQFRQCWLPVHPADQSRLGQANVRLGIDTIAGSKVPDYNSRFCVMIGPVNYQDYLTLEPDGPRRQQLLAIAKLFAGDGLNVDFQILLKKEEIPFSRLSNTQPTKLGWNCWAKIAH